MMPPNNYPNQPYTGPILPPSYQPVVIQNTPRQSSHLLNDILMFWLGWSVRKHYVERRQAAAIATAQAAELTSGSTTKAVPATSELVSSSPTTVTLRGSAIRVTQELLTILFESSLSIEPTEMRSLKQLSSLMDQAWNQAYRQVSFGEPGEDAELSVQSEVVQAMLQVCNTLLSSNLTMSENERAKARILRDLLQVTTASTQKGNRQ